MPQNLISQVRDNRRLQWFFANVLGVCILFPLGMTVSLRQFAKLKLENRFLEALAVFALLARRVGAGLPWLAIIRCIFWSWRRRSWPPPASA